MKRNNDKRDNIGCEADVNMNGRPVTPIEVGARRAAASEWHNR